MSVLPINKKVFEQVLNRMLYYANQTTVGINYCEFLHRGSKEQSMSEYEMDCQKIVQGWSNLVIKSHHYKYTPNETLLGVYFETIQLDKKASPINTYQFLKFLTSINFQIEVETIGTDRMTLDETISYCSLVKLIEDIKNTIIKSLPEYQKAEWSNPV